MGSEPSHATLSRISSCLKFTCYFLSFSAAVETLTTPKPEESLNKSDLYLLYLFPLLDSNESKKYMKLPFWKLCKRALGVEAVHTWSSTCYRTSALRLR